MSDEIRFIERQNSAEKAQVAKLAKFAERRLFAVNGDRKRGMPAEVSEKDQFAIDDEVFDLVSFQQHDACRFAGDERTLSPHRKESRFLACRGFQ